MAAPLAKGLIITASVLVAAGIAFYENETIREWILNSRRKLALALHSLGDELNPPSRSRSNSEVEDDVAAAEMRRSRREEIIRLNRLELMRQAREEGISVDLDELVRLGSDLDTPLPPSLAASQNVEGTAKKDGARSFDELVGPDGTLKAHASGADTGASGLRHRGARGLDAGSSMANPFDDEAQLLFDRDLIGGSSASIWNDAARETRESTKTVSPDTAKSDTTSQYFSEDEMDAQIEEAIRRSLSDAPSPPTAQPSSDSTPDLMDMEVSVPLPEPSSSPASEMRESSYYYAPPPHVHQPPLNGQSLYASAMELPSDVEDLGADNDSDGANTPTGVLTPTEDGMSTVASLVGSQAEDVGRMEDFHSMMDEDENMDARSEATSEAYSMVGAHTPNSWTDVESEAGEEAEMGVAPAASQPHVATLPGMPPRSS